LVLFVFYITTSQKLGLNLLALNALVFLPWFFMRLIPAPIPNDELEGLPKQIADFVRFGLPFKVTDLPTEIQKRWRKLGYIVKFGHLRRLEERVRNQLLRLSKETQGAIPAGMWNILVFNCWNRVAPAWGLELLNLPKPADDVYNNLIQSYKENASRLTDAEILMLFAAMISHTLRIYVDDWLKTGVKEDGSDCPFERDIWHSREGLTALKEYVTRHPDILPFFVGSGSDRDHYIVLHSLSRSDDWDTLCAKAIDEAQRVFTLIATFGLNAPICKCDYKRCGHYFMPERPRRRYRHGTFCCVQHQRVTNAITSKAIRWRRHQSELIKNAARELFDWSDKGVGWSKNALLTKQLAATLSQQIARDPNMQIYRQTVTTNWLTLHKFDIERERRRLERAKRTEQAT